VSICESNDEDGVPDEMILHDGLKVITYEGREFGAEELMVPFDALMQRFDYESFLRAYGATICHVALESVKGVAPSVMPHTFGINERVTQEKVNQRTIFFFPYLVNGQSLVSTLPI